MSSILKIILFENANNNLTMFCTKRKFLHCFFHHLESGGGVSHLALLLGQVQPFAADNDPLDLSSAFVNLVNLSVTHKFLHLKKIK